MNYFKQFWTGEGYAYESVGLEDIRAEAKQEAYQECLDLIGEAYTLRDFPDSKIDAAFLVTAINGMNGEKEKLRLRMRELLEKK